MRISTCTLALAALAVGFGSIGSATELEEAAREWRRAHGLAWQIERDETTGFADFIHGARHEGPFRPSGEADAETIAWIALAESAALHGVKLETLEVDRALRLPLEWTTDKWTVRFRQSIEGVPVHQGTTNVLLAEDGSLLSIHSGALPDIDRLPALPLLDAYQAEALARESFSSREGRGPGEVGIPRLEVFQAIRGAHRVPRLTWRIDVSSESPGEEPAARRYWIDARDGSVSKEESLVHGFDVGGTVYTYTTSGIGPDDANSTTDKIPLAHVEVQAFDNGQPVSVFTAEDGTFLFPGVASVTDLLIKYNGLFAHVSTDFGFATKVQEAFVAGLNNEFTMNAFNGGPPPPANINTPQANAYVVPTKLRDWIRSVNPWDDTADFQAKLTVNIGTSWCSAGKYSNQKISLYDEVDQHPQSCPSGANNASYSTIVAHEMGHWLSYLYESGTDWHMKEGTGDIFAMYLYDSPDLFFDYFVLKPGPARSGENDTSYAGYPYGDLYESGEVWMGVAWKMRRNLHVTYPHPPGQTSQADTIADALFLGWMNAFDQTSLQPKVLKQWLILDDDDGNLCNGTPHFVELEAAWTEQGFPAYQPPFYCVVFDVLAAPPDGDDEGGPYLVQAQVEADSSFPLASVTLHYAVDGGGFTAVPMTLTSVPDVWEGAIPGQASPAKVGWYLTASDVTGASANFPEDAPATLFDFHVGRFAPVFFDDFEVDRGWTVVDQGLSAGSWERVDPIGTPLQPEDDHTGGGGTHCWITEQATVGGSFDDHEVKGGPTDLISPKLDFWGYQPFVEVAWWLSNPLGDDELLVEISYDDGHAWHEMERLLGGDDATWRVQRFTRVDPSAATDEVRFRFRVADSPDDSHLEAGIDDLTAWAFIPSGFCPPPTSYCEGKPNSVGPGATISGTGSTSVGANAFGLAVQGCPPQQFGLFFYGPKETQLPFGEGLRCVKGGVIRIPPALLTDAAGSAAVLLDLTKPPLPSGKITPGSTWYFQFWYRDPLGGTAGFNLSDGLRATFCP